MSFAGQNWRVRQPVADHQMFDSEYNTEQSQRTGMFIAEKPLRRLSDLIISEVTRTQVCALLAKIREHETLYVDWNLQSVDPYGGRTAINLYGPPGTGKSFCGDAIASELGRDVIHVNYAEIESKYVGDTSKNIRAAFLKAKQTGAVLFFDEADSILGRRLSNVTQSSDHSVNVSRSVMLLELDRFEGVAIFATNFFSNYDGAFFRRILGHIEMPLPDLDCRRRLWHLYLPKEMPGAKQLDCAFLAERSNGMSGGEILNAVVLAASRAVTRREPHRYIMLEDVTQAIELSLTAHEASGKQSNCSSVITETNVPLDEASRHIQEREREI